MFVNLGSTGQVLTNSRDTDVPRGVCLVSLKGPLPSSRWLALSVSVLCPLR
jgi:hypothetical protein